MLLIPLAAGLFYPSFKIHLPPAFAGLAMGLSSVCVVLSSLSIYRFQPPATAADEIRQSRRDKLRWSLKKCCCCHEGPAYARVAASPASEGNSDDLEMNVL